MVDKGESTAPSLVVRELTKIKDLYTEIIVLYTIHRPHVQRLLRQNLYTMTITSLTRSTSHSTLLANYQSTIRSFRDSSLLRSWFGYLFGPPPRGHLQLIWYATQTVPLNGLFNIMTKGIAVHPELTYVVLRPWDKNQPYQHVIIVAKDRMEVMKDVIGPFDIIAELQGDVQSQLLLGTSIYHAKQV
jgi:hypothetical protein